MAGSGLSQHTAHLTDYQDQDESFSVTHDTTMFVCSRQGRNHWIFRIIFILSFLISFILAIFQVYSHIEYSCVLCVNIIRHQTIATQINQQFCFVTKQHCFCCSYCDIFNFLTIINKIWNNEFILIFFAEWNHHSHQSNNEFIHNRWDFIIENVLQCFILCLSRKE